MKATFEVESIEYTREGTKIELTMGKMPDDDGRLGKRATVLLSGTSTVNLHVEQLVTLTIHDKLET